MSDPYLSKDESLILSTQNIRINGMSLDLMLTSRRLILIDNSVNPFHLRTIPLDSIITVVAGMDVKGDPVFTLSHMDPSGSGAPQPMDFIFVRQKGKPRTKECNEWAATLNIHAAEARNGALSSGTLPYDPVKTIEPRMSATYMIETFSPRKPVMEAYPLKTGPVITPVPLKSPVGGGILAGADEPAPLKNVEMVEPFDSPWLLPPEPEKKEMPDKEEPASPPPVIATVTEKNPAITDAEQASPPPVIVTVTEENPTITDASQESTPSVIASVTEENPAITDAAQESTPQVIESVTEENPAITDAAQASPPPVIASVTEENPAITDAAQAWADAVRTVTTPLPVIPLMMTSATTPDGKNIDAKSKSESIDKTLEEILAEVNKNVSSADGITPQSPADESIKPSAPNAAPVPLAISPPATDNHKRTY
ncbi:MAG: hypothetical protein Q7U51_00460, partial [Methanoregula sp.]|nr:hypothetical protein [Methanoregula sp.]